MTKNSFTKMKSIWKARYGSEFDCKWTINFDRDKSELLKLNVRPKSMWFVQHALSDDYGRSDERDDIEGGKILLGHNKPTVNDYEKTEDTNAIYQVRPIGDKKSFNVCNGLAGDKSFESTWDDDNTAHNSTNVDDSVADGMANKVSEHNFQSFDNRRWSETNSFEFPYDNSIHSNESFYTYASTEHTIRKDLKGYGSNQRRSNVHYGLRDIPRRHNSPNFFRHNRNKYRRHNTSSKPHYSNYKRHSDSCYNSPQADYSKHDEIPEKFHQRKPLLESRWNSSEFKYISPQYSMEDMD